MTRELRSLEPPDDGAASLHSGNPAWCRSVSGLALPRSAGRVSTLARERPVALSRGLPSTGKSLPRGFSTRLSPRWSNLTVPLPAPVTPFDRARGAPSPWVVDGPTPVVTSHRESAEPVCKHSPRVILNVGVPAGHYTVVCATERTRFTPAVNGGILSLYQDRPAGDQNLPAPLDFNRANIVGSRTLLGRIATSRLRPSRPSRRTRRSLRSSACRPGRARRRVRAHGRPARSRRSTRTLPRAGGPA